MHDSRLTNRLRDILRAPASERPAAPIQPRPPAEARDIGATLASSAAAALAGTIVQTVSGPCVHVRRTYAADHRHGCVRVGEIIDDLHEGAMSAARLMTDASDPPVDGAPQLLFMDLETTGLAGGAGTYAFLVGCASAEASALRIDQYFMLGHALERALLAAIREPIAASGALVTYNGKTFDVPVLETRFLFHREPPPCGGRPHLDLLHMARRLWRGARGVVAAPGAQSDSCALTAMEQALFGFRRHGDVPGFEIPGRFFAFLRSADARPLDPVLEHNRLDLLSLAALTARVSRLVRESPDRLTDARECYGVGRLLEQRGEDAERWYARALALADRSWHAVDELVRVQALRALAVHCRRQARYAEAAAHWERVSRSRRCPPAFMQEALEALAIHYEHRSRDLDQARRYAERSREASTTRARANAVEHRLARLQRKGAVGLFPQR
jgi:uncharacterized protein YprB with RNaseH-like and TPR domain